MSKFQNWQGAKYNFKMARDWLSNAGKKDSQDGKHYKLIVTVSDKTFQFC